VVASHVFRHRDVLRREPRRATLRVPHVRNGERRNGHRARARAELAGAPQV